MEFKSLTNIESSFRRIRLMLAVFVGCFTLVTVFADRLCPVELIPLCGETA